MIIEGKELLDMLYEQPKLFDHYMRNKQYSEAKYCYDSTLNTMLKLRADERMMIEFFGERGERGVILQEGLFREEKVQKTYYEVAVKRDGGYENKKYEHWQKNSA